MREAVLAAASATCPVYIWDLLSAAEVGKFSEINVGSGSLCRLGKSLFAGSISLDGSKEIQVWDFGRVHPLHKSSTPERIGALAGSHSGAYLAGGGHSGAIYVWEVASGRLLRSWPGHYKAVTCLTFADDDSTLLSGGADANVAAWSLVWILRRASQTDGKDASAAVAPSCVWSEHRQAITGVSCSGSANMVVISSSLDHTCKIWSLSMKVLLQSVVFPYAVNAALLDPGEHALYAGGSDGRIYITALSAANSNKPLLSASDTHPVRDDALCGHSGAVVALAFSCTGLTLVSGGDDRTVRVWDVSAKQLIRTILHEGPVSCLLVLPLPPILPQRQLASSRSDRAGQAPKGLPSALLTAKLAKAPDAEGSSTLTASAPVALGQRWGSSKQELRSSCQAFASRLDATVDRSWIEPGPNDEAKQAVRVAWDLYRFCADELLSFSGAYGD